MSDKFEREFNAEFAIAHEVFLDSQSKKTLWPKEQMRQSLWRLFATGADFGVEAANNGKEHYADVTDEAGIEEVDLTVKRYHKSIAEMADESICYGKASTGGIPTSPHHPSDTLRNLKFKDESIEFRVNFTDLEPFKSLIAKMIWARSYYKIEKKDNIIDNEYDVENIRTVRSNLFLSIMDEFEKFLGEAHTNMHKGE